MLDGARVGWNGIISMEGVALRAKTQRLKSTRESSKRVSTGNGERYKQNHMVQVFGGQLKSSAMEEFFLVGWSQAPSNSDLKQYFGQFFSFNI